MKKVEFALIERFSLGILIGFSYLPYDDENNFSELNIYVIFIVLHFKFYNDADT
jgi:hypothetical protein|tara:strand:+ start:279 stop:440 length:162 start_codon:yes stop_codon:yes gene_type:complete